MVFVQGWWSLPAYGVVTNLVTNGNFSATGTGMIGAPTPGIGSQWSTQAGNGFDVVGQGQRGAPANGSDANPTGNTLEIRGNQNAGVITLTLAIPNNIVIGPNNATLNFDSFSRNSAFFGFFPVNFQDTGRYRIQVSGSTNSDTGLLAINNTLNTWSANSVGFTVVAGDTVTVSWSETGSSSGFLSPAALDAGLRIDDVQVLVDIAAVMAVPEPASIAMWCAGLFMLAAAGKRVLNQ